MISEEVGLAVEVLSSWWELVDFVARTLPVGLVTVLVLLTSSFLVGVLVVEVEADWTEVIWLGAPIVGVLVSSQFPWEFLAIEFPWERVE